jgi:hypothetical protein
MLLRENIAFFVSLVISVGLHLVVVPVIYSKNESSILPSPPNTILLETPPLDKQEVELGIDESIVSTLTWIGYDTYEEQLAKHSEVEQAEMHSEVTVFKNAIESMRKIAKPMSQLTSQFLKKLAKLTVPIPSNKLTPSQTKQEKELEDQFVPELPEQLTKEELAQDDRDSEATSLIKVAIDDLKLGKPLAAHGIVLKPKVIKFLSSQLAVSTPSNVLVDLFIDKTGKPLNVNFLIGTGSASFDRTIENSLYRWRASGKQVDALIGDETIRITIQLLFN